MNFYKYKIIIVDEVQKWIFITHNDWDEPEAFIALLKKIRDDCNGKIIEVGDWQFKIEGDSLDLIYQFDSLFGTVVIYNKKSQKDLVIDFLKDMFEKVLPIEDT